ncbi:MAG TPA: tetratricopeptide repeat protein, partial [Gammaproteobacteria bacterium]|nr:tetratricopeptide repeat protein [Gammaproteobacteria bacterium]
RSAEQYALAGDDRRAAENFERAKKYLKAAKYYEVCEIPLRAAENYAAHYEQVHAEHGGDLEALSRDREYAMRAGELYRESGQSQKAGKIFQMAGHFAEAAASLRTTGDYTGAAEMLMRAEKPLLAAEVLEEAGERDAAFKMRAEAALKDGDRLTAARMFRDAGDDQKAMELFEEEGAVEEAAQIAEKKGLQQKALELYEAAEMWAHAARCAETAQKWSRAAELFQKANDVDGELRALIAAGQYFRAAQLQFEHRRHDDALATAVKIDSRDDDYARGLELQGDVLRAQNRFEKAFSRYKASLGTDAEVDDQTIHVFYKMARCLEEAGDLQEAITLYKQLSTNDKNYEDVGLRVKAVRGRLRRGSMPGVSSSSGIFAAPDAVQNQRYEVLDEIARGGMGIV